MRIGYISDTHFEFQNRNVSKFLDSLVVDGLDCLLLAGDISTLDRESYTRFIVNTNNVLRQARERFKCPVYAVNGNHEFYGLDMKKYSPYDHSSNDFDKIYSGGNYGKTLKGDVVLLACTLWTDYCLMGKENQINAMRVCNSLSDSRLIKVNGRPFSSDEALKLHLKDRTFLIESLKDCIKYKKKPIILTHHVPHSAARNEKFPLDLMSAGFYSDLDDVISLAESAGCLGWIFGHHHWCVSDYSSFNFPLLSCQAGYVKEDINWDGKIGILEV